MKDHTSPADNRALALTLAWQDRKPQTRTEGLEAFDQGGATLEDKPAVLQWANNTGGLARETFDAWEAQAVEAAEIAKEKQLADAAADALKELQDLAAEGEPSFEKTKRLENGTRALLEKLTGEQAPEPELLDLAALTRHLENDREGIETGLEAFKTKDIRLPRGALTVICARPGKGKTSLMLTLARNLSGSSSVLFYSYEEAVYRLAVKLALGILGPNTPKASGEAWRAVCEAIRGKSPAGLPPNDPRREALGSMCRKLLAILGRSLFFYEGPSSIAALVSAIRRERARMGEKLEAVFIDYCQLIPSGGPSESYSRQTELAGVSAALRDLAKETGLAVILGAQITRGNKKGEELSIREADDILNDANLVLRLDPVKETEGAPATVMPYCVGVEKNRDGATGTILELAFRGRCRHFIDPGTLAGEELKEYDEGREKALEKPSNGKPRERSEPRM